MFDMIGGLGVGMRCWGIVGRMGVEGEMGRYSLRVWNIYNVKDRTKKIREIPIYFSRPSAILGKVREMPNLPILTMIWQFAISIFVERTQIILLIMSFSFSTSSLNIKVRHLDSVIAGRFIY